MKSHVLQVRENVNCTRRIFKISFSKFDAVLYILFGIFLTVKTNWMNLNSREFRTLNIQSRFDRRCCRCCLKCFLQLGKRVSACTFYHLFVRLPSLWRLFVVCRLSKHFSAVYSVVIACAGDISLLFELLLKFWNVLKHTENGSVLACNQNTQEDIATALQIFICFEAKRNETKRHKCKQILHKTFTQRASNTAVSTKVVPQKR